MNQIETTYTDKNFENIKHIDEYENEYWEARELQKVLEYKEWRNFEKVIKKAIISAETSISKNEDWVVEFNKPIKAGKGKEEYIKDYKLSRYICYLIVQNAAPNKKVVAVGQTYFAIQTKQKLMRENIQGETNAKKAHNLVGKEVRKTIKRLGGTIPEDVPTPKKSLKELEKENPKIYNIIDKLEYLKEVASLEYYEWADNPNNNPTERINNKIKRIEKTLNKKDFCKLILLNGKNLVGFISLFPSDCKEHEELTPWYATMYVKKEFRGNGYSKVLNNAILEEAHKRGFKKVYLKTELVNYYEKFDAKFISNINLNEKLYKIEL